MLKNRSIIARGEKGEMQGVKKERYKEAMQFRFSNSRQVRSAVETRYYRALDL